MFTRLQLKAPGVFVTATDTEVGKTVAACCIAALLRRQVVAAPGSGAASRVGVCKPFATGCRREREGLVSEDAEALAHFADCRLPLEVINPVRFAPPVAPAVAAEMTGQAVDFDAIARALHELDAASDAMVVEGVGGVMTPLDAKRTVLDLAAALPYPVVVVTRAGLGTLNHTAMTVRLLREVGCTVAGLIVNGYEPDIGKHTDASMATNRQWLERMNRVPILATLPPCDAANVQPGRGRIDGAITDAMAMTFWPRILG